MLKTDPLTDPIRMSRAFRRCCGYLNFLRSLWQRIADAFGNHPEGELARASSARQVQYVTLDQRPIGSN
jgi:hypothetical protein